MLSVYISIIISKDIRLYLSTGSYVSCKYLTNLVIYLLIKLNK